MFGKVSVYNAGDLGSIPGSGESPGEWNGRHSQVFLAEESHGQRSLARCCTLRKIVYQASFQSNLSPQEELMLK